MSYLVDSHCHLHDREFFSEEQAEGALERARKRGVGRVICIGTSHENSLRAREFAVAHAGVFWTYGIHPENASGACDGVSRDACRRPSLRGRLRSLAPRWSQKPSKSPSQALGDFAVKMPIRQQASRENPAQAPIGIGEVGLDYHYPGYDRDKQIRLLEEMLQLAVENDLPVSFHVREAFDDFFPVVGNFQGVRGVVHSFSDNKKNLRRILETTDFYVGVNGMATYSTLPTPPLSRILLETDAPFLTPKPFRGIMNESGYIVEIATWLGEKLGESFDTVRRETTRNAEQLFGLGSAIICEEGGI